MVKSHTDLTKLCKLDMNYSGRSSSTVILLIRVWNETYSGPKGANPSIHWNTYLQVLLTLINPATKNIQYVLIRKSYLGREKQYFCTIGMIFFILEVLCYLSANFIDCGF